MAAIGILCLQTVRAVNTLVTKGSLDVWLAQTSAVCFVAKLPLGTLQVASTLQACIAIGHRASIIENVVRDNRLSA